MCSIMVRGVGAIIVITVFLIIIAAKTLWEMFAIMGRRLIIVAAKIVHKIFTIMEWRFRRPTTGIRRKNLMFKWIHISVLVCSCGGGFVHLGLVRIVTPIMLWSRWVAATTWRVGAMAGAVLTFGFTAPASAFSARMLAVASWKVVGGSFGAITRAAAAAAFHWNRFSQYAWIISPQKFLFQYVFFATW